jgi:hypothetical protein
MSKLKIGNFAIQALVLALLGACSGGGGGGGGGTVPVSPPLPPPPATFPPLSPPHMAGDFPATTGSEFRASWGPAGTNVQIAWQHGATGAGITVGVIDDGIDPNNQEFVGRVSPDSIDINAARDQLTTTNETHGSAVAAIIAANYNNVQTVGLAFDATILAIRADNGNGAFFESDLVNAIDYARTHGAKVVNLSLGGSDPSSLALQQAIQRATAAGVILVFAAGNEGNDGATQADYPGFLATNSAVSNGLIMIAGGLNDNGAVNSDSNPPGAAANWYLTAPGWQIVVPDFGLPGGEPGFESCFTGASGQVCQIQGTSFAAPQVAGAVALVMQAFPGLTPQQVVDLLFTTADDTGAVGTDSVNGRGRLNIGRAFQPVGNLEAPITSQGAQTTWISPSMPMGVVGPAFGDGLTRNVGQWTIASFDSFGRTFPVNVAANWLHAAAGPELSTQAPQLWRTATDNNSGFRMQLGFTDSPAPDSYRTAIDRQDLIQTPTRIDANLGNGLSLAFAANGVRTMYDNAPDNVGHLDFVNASSSLQLTQRLNDVTRVAFLTETGKVYGGLDQDAIGNTPTARTANAVRTSFDLGALDLDVTYGVLDEQEALLGLSWANQLGETPSGQTQFMGLGGHLALAQGWRMNWDAEYGRADLQSVGWLRVADPIQTSAYSLEAEHDFTPSLLNRLGGAGVFTLSVSQPLRVDGGAFSFMAPTATSYGRKSLTYELRMIDPTPSGRELRFGLGYRFLAGDWLTAYAEATYVLDPGHVADADPAAVFQFGFRLAN